MAPAVQFSQARYSYSEDVLMRLLAANMPTLTLHSCQRWQSWRRCQRSITLEYATRR